MTRGAASVNRTTKRHISSSAWTCGRNPALHVIDTLDFPRGNENNYGNVERGNGMTTDEFLAPSQRSRLDLR
jgi:hypothetical protein